MPEKQPEVKLMVSLDAVFVWEDEPLNEQQKLVRDAADKQLKVTAKKLESAAYMLVTEMLKLQAETRQIVTNQIQQQLNEQAEAQKNKSNLILPNQ